MSESTERMKQPYEMPFAEFASAVRTSGAVNRLPQLGSGDQVLSYSVYMNGKLAQQLPGGAQEQNFDGLMVHALTEKLGLNSESFRDNLKVAELAATRSAWMTAVLDSTHLSTMDRMHGRSAPELSADVVADYEKLSEGHGLGHPWMQAQIRMQQSLSKNLQPALDAAQQAIGGTVQERVPGEIEIGKIVSQNADFTVQQVADGEIVAHENRRLEKLPELGKNVTVTYYRGQGQVIDNVKELRVSDPYVEKETGDLAVSLVGEKGDVREIVLFNSVSAFSQFVDEHQLDKQLVEKALDARAATPKVVPPAKAPDRTPASEIYFDRGRQALALDYMEAGRARTVFFSGPEAVENKAKEFGMNEGHVAQAQFVQRAREMAEKEFPGNRQRQAELIERVMPDIRRQADERLRASRAQDRDAGRGQNEQVRKIAGKDIGDDQDRER
jgi:hypothetical protein